MKLSTTLRRAAIAPSLAGLAVTAAVLVPDVTGDATAHEAASADVRLVSASVRVPPIEVPSPVMIRRHALHALQAASYQLPVDHYVLTARFGEISPLWHTVHTGLDFAAPEGTPIHAVAGGVVVSTGYDGDYGNKTVVRLDDGTVLWYCHQSAFEVHPGERVATGQRIGLIGATGNTTGPHLHLEVHPHGGAAVDPYAWLVHQGLHP